MLARTNKRGFTLVEILIVVIILGILAAIVIPQFTNASQDARNSSLVSQLQTLRSQVELYKLQHKDVLPDLITSWDPLITKTDADGGTTGSPLYGPYLQAAPSNPLTNSTTVTDGDGTTATGLSGGFIYDYNSGNGTGRVWGVDGAGALVN